MAQYQTFMSGINHYADKIRFHFFDFNHLGHFLDSSYLIKTVVSLPTISLYWSCNYVHQKEKCIVIADQIPSVASIIMHSGKTSLNFCLGKRIESKLHNFDIFRKQSFFTLKSRFNI